MARNDKRKAYKRSSRKDDAKDKRNFRDDDRDDYDRDDDKRRGRGKSARAGKPGTNSCNDPRWYGATPQLVADFASFPYGVATGSRYQTGFTAVDQYSVPGLMAVQFVPSVGYATDESAAINIAMRQVFSFVRKKNSGATNYEAGDLIKYMIALDSAYMYLAWMRRVYGLLLDYSYVNRYLPESIINMMGLDVDTLVTSMADFRGFINIYAAKLSSMAIPATMPYFLRHSWMCTYIYADSNTEKAQIYFYDPVAVYQYSEGGTVAESKLQMAIMPGKITAGDLQKAVVVNQTNLANLEDIQAFGYNLINPILASQDMNVMSGDILKAFEGNIVVPQGVTDEYRVFPVYDEEVLSQIMNCNPLGAVDLDSLEVVENVSINGGYVTSTPSVYMAQNSFFYGNSGTTAYEVAVKTLYSTLMNLSASNGGQIHAPWASNRYVTFQHGNITPDETMVATRLANIVSNIQPGSQSTASDYIAGYLTGDVRTAGSEIVTNVVTGTFTWTNNVRKLTMTTMNVGLMTWVLTQDGSNAPTMNQIANRFRDLPYKMEILESFDWHPTFWPTFVVYNDNVATEDFAATVREATHAFVDMGNFTMLTEHNLINLAQVALLSEFYVPAIGTMNIGLN